MNKQLSPSFARQLSGLTAGYLSPDEFEKLFEAFEKELEGKYFPPSAEANLFRMISASYDRITLLTECLRYPHHMQILLNIAINSNYLTDIAVRNPEYLYLIFNPENLQKKTDLNKFKDQLLAEISKFKTFQAKINVIRQIKRREILRIGISDIMACLFLKEITAELSVLAAAISDCLFELCFRETVKKYQLTIEEVHYCLVSLGKLGGNELNYSSDVDLILFYRENFTFPGSNKEYQEILTEAAHLFIQTSTAMTERGHIYRVDFRLRPDGRNSQLCRSLKSYLNYYETRGEDWERQMLIKSGFAGGSRDLFDEFIKNVNYFIYTPAIINSPLESISRMKQNIEKKLEGDENVKLFPGGIRDIEFSIQALQIINGAKYKDLRTGNTLDAIESLLEHNLLTQDETLMLVPAYEFYRRIEHFIQLMNDTQTHIIPQEGELLSKLIQFLGIKDAAAFNNMLTRHRTNVRKFFNSIFITDISPEEGNSFEKIKFHDIKKALSNYNFLRTGKSIFGQKSFDKNTVDAFQRIEPSLLDFLAQCRMPDEVLDRFARVIKNTNLPSIWYNEFQNRSFFTKFLEVCYSSLRAIELLTFDNSLAEDFLTRKVFIKNLKPLTEELNLKQLMFFLAVQFSLGLINANLLSGYLCQHCKHKLQILYKRFCFPEGSFLFALGSFGSGEMTFASDIDLVLITSKEGHNEKTQNDFSKFLAEAKSLLKPLEIDCRLRPEGKSSMLVWELESYKDYIYKRAQTWELQSMLKSQLIAGEQSLFDSLIGVIVGKLRTLDKEIIRRDIIEMRDKTLKQLSSSPQSNYANFFHLKKSKGGMLDIEFTLHGILLSNPDLYLASVGKSNEKIIELLSQYPEFCLDCEALIFSHSFLKKMLVKMQIIYNSNGSVLPLDKAKREILAERMGYKSIDEMEKQLQLVIEKNRSFYLNNLSGK